MNQDRDQERPAVHPFAEQAMSQLKGRYVRNEKLPGWEHVKSQPKFSMSFLNRLHRMIFAEGYGA